MRRLAALLIVLPLAACSSKSSTLDGVAITATDSSCTVAQTTFAAGDVTFAVTNKGAKVTEVYVYSGPQIVTEVENIGPGTSRTMKATLAPGAYEIACKPGQTGDGIRTPITVMGTTSSATASATANATGAPTPSVSTSAPASAHGVLVTVGANDLTLAANAQLVLGAEIEFQLRNNASATRELEIIDPNNKEVTAVEAAAGHTESVKAKLTLRGTWTLKIEGTDLVKTFTVN